MSAGESQPERLLRSLAHGLAAALAFLPAALLADARARALTAGEAARNVVVLFLITVGAALVSSSTERSPEALDSSSARNAARLGPLGVAVLVLLLPLLGPVGWPVVETALLVQLPLALFLHVPRARACHLFTVGWGVLASTTLDDRAALTALPVFFLLFLASALERGRFVRTSTLPGGPPALGLALGASAAITAVGACLSGLLLRLLPHTERARPGTPRGAAGDLPSRVGPFRDLLFAVVAAIVLVRLARYLYERFCPATPPRQPRLPEVTRSSGAVDLRPEPAADGDAWERGDRRDVVRRYLEHLRSLARLGSPVNPSDTPLEVAKRVGERDPGLDLSPERLARAFHAARYSPAKLDSGIASQAERDAKSIEATLRGERPEI